MSPFALCVERGQSLPEAVEVKEIELAPSIVSAQRSMSLIRNEKNVEDRQIAIGNKFTQPILILLLHVLRHTQCL